MSEKDKYEAIEPATAAEPCRRAPEAADWALDGMKGLSYLTQPHDGSPGLESVSDVSETLSLLSVSAVRHQRVMANMSMWLMAHQADAASAAALAAMKAAGDAATAMEEALTKAYEALSDDGEA